MAKTKLGKVKGIKEDKKLKEKVIAEIKQLDPIEENADGKIEENIIKKGKINGSKNL